MIVEAKNVDWWCVVTDLNNSGWSMGRLSRHMRKHKSWFSALRNIPGTQPKFMDGLSLLSIWCEVMGKGWEDVPTERPTFSAHQIRSGT